MANVKKPLTAYQKAFNHADVARIERANGNFWMAAWHYAEAARFARESAMCALAKAYFANSDRAFESYMASLTLHIVGKGE